LHTAFQPGTGAIPTFNGASQPPRAEIKRRSTLARAAPLELDPLQRLLEPIDTSTLAGRRDLALLLGLPPRSRLSALPSKRHRCGRLRWH
jgi:hypothetical protein